LGGVLLDVPLDYLSTEARITIVVNPLTRYLDL